MGGDPLSDSGQPRLGVQGFRPGQQAVMQFRDRCPQWRIADAGVVHRRAGEPGRKERPIQIDLAFSESADADRRAAVVRHPGRQDRHGLTRGSATAAVQVISDRAVVDDEHRPSLVAVRRVGVIDQASVQHLADPWHRRRPRLDAAAIRQHGVHVKNVQDLGVDRH
jgi:hypothetical protein